MYIIRCLYLFVKTLTLNLERWTSFVHSPLQRTRTSTSLQFILFLYPQVTLPIFMPQIEASSPPPYLPFRQTPYFSSRANPFPFRPPWYSQWPEPERWLQPPSVRPHHRIWHARYIFWSSTYDGPWQLPRPQEAWRRLLGWARPCGLLRNSMPYLHWALYGWPLLFLLFRELFRAFTSSSSL